MKKRQGNNIWDGDNQCIKNNRDKKNGKMTKELLKKKKKKKNCKNGHFFRSNFLLF